ncbi:hypothetical protein Lal_00040026 [Lupinus albus]|nr:hypothetical protein Lal_00040026 [Lupinus albus]
MLDEDERESSEISSDRSKSLFFLEVISSSNFLVSWSFLDGLEATTKKDTATTKPTFAQAIKNTGEVSLAHLPQPCVKGDMVAVKIMEAAYQAGLQRCRNHLHGRLILAK